MLCFLQMGREFMIDVSKSPVGNDGSASTHFRASIVIFFGHVGRSIYEQFNPSRDRATEMLLTYIPQPVRKGIGLIMPGKDSDRYQVQLSDELPAQDNVSLDQAITVALNNVTCDFLDASYNIDDPSPQIFVVGHVSSKGICEVAKIVRSCWSQKYKDTAIQPEISYLFCCYPVETEGASNASPSFSDNLADWAREQQIAFCYLYGDIDCGSPDATDNVANIHYAVAVALFALVATGITSQPGFKSNIRASDDTFYHHGTLSACFVGSPQETILSACRLYCASLLISEWLPKSETSDKSIRGLVNKSVHRLKEWIEGTTIPVPHSRGIGIALHIMQEYFRIDLPRQPGGQLFQPRFSLAAHAQTEENLYNERSWRRLTAELFSPLLPPRAQWIAAMEQRYSHEKKALRPLWQEASKQLWEMACADAVQEVEQTLVELQDRPEDRTSTSTDKGPSALIAYADQLDSRLATLQDSGSLALLSQEQQEKELESEEYLRLRLDFEKARENLPSVLTMLRLTLLAVMATGVLAVLIMNISAPFVALPALPIFLFCAGCIVLMNIAALYSRFQRYLPQIVKAQYALLNYYWKQHASFCRSEEERHRKEMISTVRQRLWGLKSNTLISLQVRYEQEAKKVFEHWFNGVSATRYIFIDNGNYFGQSASQASDIFLPPLPNATRADVTEISEKPPAKTIFQRLEGDHLFRQQSEHCFYDCCFYHQGEAIERDERIAAQKHEELLYDRLKNLMVTKIGKADLTRFLDIDASAKKNLLEDKRLWDEVFKRIIYTHLWRKQEEIDRLIYLFLCGRKKVLPTREAMSNAVTQFQDKVMNVATGHASAHWFLVAALYHSSLQVRASDIQSTQYMDRE
jgi:hypothetical protein